MDTSLPFALSICVRCNAPVLSSLVDSHRISCYKNVRPPSPHLLRGRASADEGHQVTSPAPPSRSMLYVGSEGFAEDVDESSSFPNSRTHRNNSTLPKRTLGAGEAAALYSDMSLHRSVDPAPSSVRSDTMADSTDELDHTARPPPGTSSPLITTSSDDVPHYSYAHILSESPTRSSALRSFVDAGDDHEDGPRLEAYQTDWDTVLKKGSQERERLDCSKYNPHTHANTTHSQRGALQRPPSSSTTHSQRGALQGPPSLSDGYDRQYKAPSFAIASAALDSNSHRSHPQGGGAREVFLPYLRNRPRGESTATKGAPLNHRPFMLVGKATGSRRDWGSDQSDQGILSKRRVVVSQVAARPASAGRLSRGGSANNRRSSHMPAAPRMAATGTTPLSLRPQGAAANQPHCQPNSVPQRLNDMDMVLPETARALLHTADELDATFQEDKNDDVLTTNPQFKAINIRGTSGAGKIIIHRPAMLLSPRKAPPTRQSAPLQDAVWTTREVKQATVANIIMATDIPPPRKESAPRVAAVRGSSAHSRFVFPPSLRAMHPQVVSKRPSSVGPPNTSSIRGKGAVVQHPPQSTHSISPEPVPPASHRL